MCFDLFMKDTCPRCRKPIRLAVIEQHSTHRYFAVHKFECADCGITAPGKVVHSLRHRAADRLRAAGAPVDIRHALLGHEARSVAEGYGAGHLVVLLKKWIEKIRF